MVKILREKASAAVLLAQPEQLEWPKLARALASFRKIPLPDAAHEAKMSWGIVAESLDPMDAQQLLNDLSAEGLVGVMVSQTQLANVRSPRAVGRISLDQSGLGVEAKPGEHRLIPWDYFSVVAVSMFQKAAVRTLKVQEGPSAGEKLAKTGLMLITGLPLPMGKKKIVEKKIEEPELFFFLDLFLKQNGLRVRLDAQHLDYSFLKERKGFGAHGNFRLLVHDVTAYASKALLNRGARVLASGQPLTTMGYESASDLEKECRWLLTLSQTRYDRGRF